VFGSKLTERRCVLQGFELKYLILQVHRRGTLKSHGKLEDGIPYFRALFLTFGLNFCITHCHLVYPAYRSVNRSEEKLAQETCFFLRPKLQCRDTTVQVWAPGSMRPCENLILNFKRVHFHDSYCGEWIKCVLSSP